MDIRNQARQFDLALEKNWVTQDVYFRLYMTLTAMNVRDLWIFFKSSHIDGGEYPTIIEYADILKFGIIEYGRLFENPTEVVHYNVGSFVSDASSQVSSLRRCLQNYNDTHTIVILKN